MNREPEKEAHMEPLSFLLVCSDPKATQQITALADTPSGMIEAAKDTPLTGMIERTQPKIYIPTPSKSQTPRQICLYL